MANYTTANLVKAQLKLQDAFASQDTRFRDPAVWKLYLSNSENFFPDYKTLRTRDDRALEANYFKRSARALGTSYSHNHTGSRGDSGVLAPTWAVASDVFSRSLKQAGNSVYSEIEQANNDLLNVIANFMNGLDAKAVDHAFANKTGVNIATVNGAFDATNDTYEITESAFGDYIAQITKTVMDVNGYQGGMISIVCDSIAYVRFQRLAAQGAQNATNYSFQFDGIEFVHAPQLYAKAVALDATYTKGFWLAIPKNTIGALTWIESLNRNGKETSVNMYSSLFNPFDGQTYAVHSYEERADATSANGYAQDVVTQIQVWLSYALETAPLSTATESTIYAFALV